MAFLYGKTNSYEALINKRSRKFKELGIVAKECSEQDFKALLFKDYTFLSEDKNIRLMTLRRDFENNSNYS